MIQKLNLIVEQIFKKGFCISVAVDIEFKAIVLCRWGSFHFHSRFVLYFCTSHETKRSHINISILVYILSRQQKCQSVEQHNLPYVILCVTVSAKETITVCVMARIEGDVPGDLDKGIGVLVKFPLSLGLSRTTDVSIVTRSHFSTTCSILRRNDKRKMFYF